TTLPPVVVVRGGVPPRLRRVGWLRWPGPTAAQVEYEFLTLVGEFDAGGGLGWYPDFRSVAHWVSYYCSMAPGTAREHVRVARALRTMPHVEGLMRSGRLSFSKVRELTRLVGRVADEEELCELALEMTASQLARTVRTFRGVDGARVEAEVSRSFTVRDAGVGMTRVSLTLPAEAAAVVVGAVEKAARAEVTPEEGQPRCRAEAMVAVAQHYLEVTPAPAAEDDHHLVVVHVAAEVLAGLDPGDVPAGTSSGRGGVPAGTCHIEGLGPIEPATAQRVACDGRVAPAVIGADGEVLAFGRARRRASRAQRRALRIRDGVTCQFPGCEQSRHLDAHHVVPWWAGGATDLDNLVNLCRRHHTAVHEGGMSLTREAGRWVFRHRDGTVVCELDPPTPGDLAWKLVTDSRIFPPHGGEGFTLDACVTALFHTAA
ncbi:MAG: HNH endonuclease, partial [Actinomycetes bacterium]|nr:HNH endonuclease [Actinomycetes bacterium]MDX5379804.1 HNH endonuclease [Actinomycetes bacterium]MDX5398234.1 HNH endonuclease [Actinomycetes bacterium]MDX5449503.1 HNH endonuclease [Actinomycetes bacterium]